MFGNAGRDHMEKYGSTPDHYAWIGWKNHKHSVNNPYAQFQDEYTLEDIKAAKMIHDPLTKLQCSPTSDGSACAIVASERYVDEHDLWDQAIEIAGQSMVTDLSSTFDEDADCMTIVGSDMSKQAADEAYEEAQVGPDEVDVCELHDCFSANELITYEALGFAAEGEGHKLVEAEATTYGGAGRRQPLGRADLQGPPAGRDRPGAVLRADLAAARRGGQAPGRGRARSRCSTTSASAAPPWSPSTSRRARARRTNLEVSMAKQRRSLGGKVVAITGGARGIGKATATALVRKGCRVAIGDLDLGLAEQTAAGLGGGTVALGLDVTDRGSFTGFLEETERQLGPVDVVVNNAGIMPVTALVDESDDSIHRQLDINVYGVIVGTQLAIERMRPRGGGHIVNIASQAGKTAIPGIATYSGTKHAVVGICESVRAELRGSGVEVHCVMPTVVNTELTAGVGQKLIKPVEAEDVADEIVEALEVGRFDVFVPRYNAVMTRFAALMPRRVNEAIARLMKADKLMFEVDHAARRAYEERAAKSEPGLDQDAEPAVQRDAA